MTIHHEVEDLLQALQQDDLYRQRHVLQGCQGPLVNIEDKSLINFSSNDYLGLANDAQLKVWMNEAVEQYGVGAGSSQLIIGHSAAHRQLEKDMADYLGRDRALIFTCGYMANLAIASTFIDKHTIIIQDKLNHASLIDAAKLSTGRLRRYPHSNVEALNVLLDKHKNDRVIVMTDGVFSMDGDCARLRDIADLCLHYNALLIVDDAHGLGVLGKTGGGLLELLEIQQQQVPLLIGTFGKAFGLSGAFIAGDAKLIEALIQKARTYIYTTALPPAIAATIVKALKVVSTSNDKRDRVNANVKLLKSLLHEASNSTTHIQPFMIGSAADASAASRELYDKGLLVSAIRPPTVPNGTARLRISLSAAHTKEQVEKLAGAVNALVV